MPSLLPLLAGVLGDLTLHCPPLSLNSFLPFKTSLMPWSLWHWIQYGLFLTCQCFSSPFLLSSTCHSKAQPSPVLSSPAQPITAQSNPAQPSAVQSSPIQERYHYCPPTDIFALSVSLFRLSWLPLTSWRCPHLHPHPQRRRTLVGHQGATPQPAVPCHHRAVPITCAPYPGQPSIFALHTGGAGGGTAVLSVQLSPAGSLTLGDNHAFLRACSTTTMSSKSGAAGAQSLS